MCSYLPGTIADKCEEFVDEYGQKVIDAIVHEELKPTEVCSQVFPDCGEARSVECVWGPSYWCATPFHARVCGTTQICKVEHILMIVRVQLYNYFQKTVWKTLSVKVEN